MVRRAKELLCAFFFMLGLWLYARYTESPGVSRYLLVLVAFAFGLMAKPMLVTFPFVVLLLDYWPLRRTEGGSRLIGEKVPLFVLAACSSAVTLYAQRRGGTIADLELFSFGDRIGNALISYVSYLGKTLWPTDLAVYYPHPGQASWLIAFAAAVLLTGLSLALVRVRQRRPCLLVGWLWYLGMLVPVIGLVQVGAQARADRYTYLPLIGIFIGLTWGIHALIGQRKWLPVSGAVLLVVLGVVSGHQVARWKDTMTLFAYTNRVTVDNRIAHNILGNELAAKGRYYEAMQHYAEGVRIQPEDAAAHNNLGTAYEGIGKVDQAITHYHDALELDPGYVRAHYNLGSAYHRRGDLDRAIASYQMALRLRPRYVDAHSNMGAALVAQGKLDDAVVRLRKAVEINPRHMGARYNLGYALLLQSRPGEAIPHLEEVLRRNSSHRGAAGNLQKAREQLRQQSP